MILNNNLQFELLTAAHADELFPILTTPAVMAFIDPTGKPPTLAELRTEYSARARGSGQRVPTERWFNTIVRLQDPNSTAIGRLEATSYGAWGELAYVFGKDWWGKGLAFEAMNWWHDHLATAVTDSQWWATVHPDNHRSIRLLNRLGYEEVRAIDRPQIQSFDEGDRCFVIDLQDRKVGATNVD